MDLKEDTYIINDDVWEKAQKELADKYNSSKIKIIELIKDFELSNPKKKYRSDLEVFIKESKLEDFINANGETLFVSTIHKAKGKEFDNVFLMLDGFNGSGDRKKRQLYVAMTRAKQNLTLHLNGNYLDDLTTEDLEQYYDNKHYLAPPQLVMQLTHKDVWLDYFNYNRRQDLISRLKSGDELFIKGDSCCDENGNPLLKFSRQYLKKIDALKETGYELKSVTINYIVYWKKEDSEHEIRIILPELYFEKKERNEWQH